MAPYSSERTKVFISYSHEDTAWLQRLRIHLKPLERDHEIEIWDDKRIRPGAKWKQEIEKAITTAKVAVLLVSADFLASDFIIRDELTPLLEAAENEGAIILPVIVSPCRFLRTEGLSQFQSVNDPFNALINVTRGEQERIFAEVADQIEAALEPLIYSKSPKPRNNNREFLIKTKGVIAKGELTQDGFRILAGSQAKLKEQPSVASKNQFVSLLRKRLIADKLLIEERGHLRFTKDVEFTSPSTAAAIVYGYPVNGWHAWKDEKGVKLNELRHQTQPNGA